MPTTDLGAAQILASCSFCKKNNTEVKKLIAGPGVYICDECISLCDDIVAADITSEEAAKEKAKFLDRSADELLKLLPAMAATAAAVEDDLRRCAARVVTAGGTWEQVAASLSITAEAAQLRFEESAP